MPDVKQTLDGWIDYSSPKLGTFLARTWKNQQQALTYKEIREAIFAGQLDPGYLVQWRQDYSKFIINGYAPLAQQAIDNSAHEMQALFGLGAKSLNYPYIDSFIATQGGKLIREVSEEQYKAINVLVRQASFTETMDVKELAKAIRPTVGLTTRQAQAAYNRYQQAIADGYSPDKAREIQAKYAEKLHRTRAETIAITEMAYAYNYGQQAYMEQCIKDGLIGGARKKWMTAFDERVCEVCGKLDQEEAEMDAPFSIGVLVPPAHPRCRCVVNYIDVLPPAAWVDTTTAQPTQAPDNVDIPDTIDITGEMTYVKPANLGGTGEMHIVEDDQSGDEFIFKPAYKKYSTDIEAFRAYVQEAGYKVQGIIDPDSMVQVGTGYVDIPGKGQVFGAAQRRIMNLDPNFNLQSWQLNGGTLDPNIVAQLQRENVTDWLLCNYDCHGRNFVLTQDGTLIGVDKEQAFRFINQSGAQHLSYSFHPNSIYHETEPVYNTLYRRFANGEIDIKLNDTLAYIKRIEAVPDAEYREIFRNYAEALHGKGAQAEALLDKIVARKQNVRAEFETFYTDLLSKRKGTKTAFIFADTPGVAAYTVPTPATTAFTPATLKGLKLADLQAIAKAQGIKNFGILHKNELIDVISDPSKQQQVFQTALNRAHQQYATRNARKKTPQAANPQFGGVTQLSDALKDIDGALKGSTPKGVALISDDRALEGLETNLRKITIDGKEYYELSGKLTQTRWEQTLQNMSGQSSGSNWRWNQVQGSIDYTQPVLNLTSTTESFSLGTKYIRQGDDIIVVAGSGAENGGRAFMGAFNIRVEASNGTDAARKIQSLMQQAGITDIADDATTAALDRYKKMRVIWQTAPSEAASLNVATVTDAQIDGVLKKLGITQKRLDAIQVRKVADGYWTLYDPENVALAKKYGAAYLYHEAGSIDAAANVLTSGELLATTNRYGRGIFATGASSFADMGTGGADNVFTRIVFDNQVGKEKRYGSFGDYVFIFDPKALERTDWYAYDGDRFGTTEDYAFNIRYGTAEHFQRSRNNYKRSNELLFRKTLPLDTLTEVRVPSHQRQALIDKLHSVGISEINGIRLENLVKTVERLV